MKRLIALALLLEGFASGVRAVSLPTLVLIYPLPTVAVLLLRAVVGVVQFTSGWMIWQVRPFGATLGALSLLASALLLVFEIGLGLSANSVFHSYRWPVVAGYALYALAAAWVLRPRNLPSN
jgi:cytochrome b subunit of formate dehydrogenase